MKTLIAVSSLLLICGCADTQLAEHYVGNKPQTFATSITPLGISTLKVYRSARHPGKLWVEPNAGKKLAIAWSVRQTQFAALFATIEPAYRAAALSALEEQPGGDCKINAAVPWPTQFAIEFAFECS